jgi:DNA-binding transcriptional LysR family regulator
VDHQAPAATTKIICFRPGCSYRARLEAMLAARGLVNIRRLEFGTLDGIIGCVGAGMGITMLPRTAVARAEAEGRIALHALPADEARVQIVLVRRRDTFLSSALARFIEIAREHLAVQGDMRRARTRKRRPAPAAAPTVTNGKPRRRARLRAR